MNYRFLYHLFLCQFFISMSFWYAALASAADWTIQDLGTLGNNRSGSYANDINNRGQVVGASKCCAFLYDSAGMHSLGLLDGDGSQAFGINASGKVVGSILYSDWLNTSGHLSEMAFLYDGTTMYKLGTLGGADYDKSIAYAINASGVVVGMTTVNNGSVLSSSQAFLYDGTGMYDIGALCAGGASLDSLSQAFDINASGQVVGYCYTSSTSTSYAFLYDSTGMRNLGTLGGANTSAYAINDIGQVVGYSKTSDGVQHAFMYDSTGMQDLGTLGGTSWGSDINTRGQVVGESYLSGNVTRRGFFYDGGVIRDLNTLPEVIAAGWNLSNGSTSPYSVASAINDSGQIIGTGINSAGQIHAYRLHPQSMSRYMKTVDPTTLYNLGCGQTKQSGVTMLDFGAPASDSAGTYGATIFRTDGSFATTSGIETGVKAFLNGYYACHGLSHGMMTVAVGTSNFGNQVTCAHGEAWGTMIGNLNSYLISLGYVDRLQVVGASDMELKWNSPSITKTWANCYATTAPVGYYNYGDANGCPTTGFGSCYTGWTVDDVWEISFGGGRQTCTRAGNLRTDECGTMGQPFAVRLYQG
jgi:probable HAF family extracellular repeat protein